GSDFITAAGVVTIPAGAVESSPILVTLVDDDVAEGDESFSITLSEPVNVTLVDVTATATIIDDDAPVITLTTIQADASEAGDPAVFRFTRSAAGQDDLVVRYRLLSGDVGQADASDVQEPITDQVVIPAGELFVDLTLTPV